MNAYMVKSLSGLWKSVAVVSGTAWLFFGLQKARLEFLHWSGLPGSVRTPMDCGQLEMFSAVGESSGSDVGALICSAGTGLGTLQSCTGP